MIEVERPQDTFQASPPFVSDFKNCVEQLVLTVLFGIFLFGNLGVEFY